MKKPEYENGYLKTSAEEIRLMEKWESYLEELLVGLKEAYRPSECIMWDSKKLWDALDIIAKERDW